jgi:hypothetical protein
MKYFFYLIAYLVAFWLCIKAFHFMPILGIVAYVTLTGITIKFFINLFKQTNK